VTAIRVVIVGAGVIGRRQADAVRALGDQVAGFTDPDLARAEQLAAEFGAAAYRDPAALPAGTADAAVIASPSWAHCPQAVSLLGQGMDVLVEKPHRIPGEAPEPLARAIAATGQRYFVGMTTRHWPGLRAAARAVADGRLGRLLSYTDRIQYRLGPDDLAPWYFDPKISGGGALLTNGVHAIDRARAVLGAPLELLSSTMETVFPGHRCEDAAHLALRTDRGVPVTLDIAWSPYRPPGTGLQINGTDGVARVEMDGSWLVATADGEEHGDPIGVDEPFRRQWQAFRDGEAGFGLADLEPTLTLIEQIYRQEAACRAN
jgi:predicted dehydrogenase